MSGPPPRGRSAHLLAAMERLWAIMAEDYGLFPSLALDAVLARADRGELAAATPRLLQLVTGQELDVADAAAAVARLGGQRWSPAERAAIVDVLDAWWLETLRLLPGEHTEPYDPQTVLGILVGYRAPMVRWLQPWLDELDGPGAAHLASVILGGPDALSGPAWTDKRDEALQVLGWARTEPVVNGLTLIGGIHLDDGMLGAVLDRLIG